MFERFKLLPAEAGEDYTPPVLKFNPESYNWIALEDSFVMTAGGLCITSTPDFERIEVANNLDDPFPYLYTLSRKNSREYSVLAWDEWSFKIIEKAMVHMAESIQSYRRMEAA